jgi:glucosyl-dolichyl phosphate glucuronosyltransferase
MTTTTSVLVPTRNRPDDLRVFVRSLVVQTRKPDELVVVDSGDLAHPIEEILRTGLEGSGIALIYARSEAGTSLQRNVAVGLSRGEILVFCDDDVVLSPECIDKLLACFDLERTPPVGGAAGTIVNAPYAGKAVEIVYGLFGLTHWSDRDDPRLYASGGVRYVARPTRILDVPVTSSTITAFRRACFDGERWAEFLPGYTLNEDVELSFRIAKKWTLVQTPHARAVHNESPAGRHTFASHVSRLIYAKYWFVRQHRPHDVWNVGALAWANVGLLALYVRRGLADREPGLTAILGGVADGYRRCIRDWWKGNSE